MATTYVKGCNVDACERKHDSHGYCNAHSNKVKRHGSAYGPYKPMRIAKSCSVDECSKPGKVKGLCIKHSRWKIRTGDPSVRPERIVYIPPSKKNKQAKYKFTSVKNHSILEDGLYTMHRVIMAEHIGRELYANENVHHKNGDRMDNRIENLELWTVSQPSGQRVEDKVQWAIETLKRYQPELLKEGV
jgi:HNH endonuclease